MFQFRQFTIHQDLCAMKVGTDGVLLGAWANGGDCILDIGTGTGLIALMMAQRFAEARVVAVDIDEAAVLQARQNVAASPFKERIEIFQHPIQSFANQSDLQGQFSAVVCNPPFFTNSLKAPNQQRTVARHTVTLSYAELMRAAAKLLSADGELSVVVPFDYQRQMQDEAIFAGLFTSRVCAVRTTASKPPRRYLLAFGKSPCACQKEELTIGSEYYQQLTRDFYLIRE